MLFERILKEKKKKVNIFFIYSYILCIILFVYYPMYIVYIYVGKHFMYQLPRNRSNDRKTSICPFSFESSIFPNNEPIDLLWR